MSRFRTQIREITSFGTSQVTASSSRTRTTSQNVYCRNTSNTITFLHLCANWTCTTSTSRGTPKIKSVLRIPSSGKVKSSSWGRSRGKVRKHPRTIRHMLSPWLKSSSKRLVRWEPLVTSCWLTSRSKFMARKQRITSTIDWPPIHSCNHSNH